MLLVVIFCEMLVGPRTRAPSHAARSLLNLNADSEGRHKPYGLWPRQHDSVRSYDLTYVQPSASPYGNERFLYPSETRRGGPYGSLPLRSSPRHYSQGERPMSGSIPEVQPYGCSSKGLVLLGGSRLLRDSSSHIETTVGGRSYDPRTLHGDKGGSSASCEPPEPYDLVARTAMPGPTRSCALESETEAIQHRELAMRVARCLYVVDRPGHRSILVPTIAFSQMSIAKARSAVSISPEREPSRLSYEIAAGENASPSPCGTAHDGACANASTPSDCSVEAARSQHPCCFVSAADESRLGSRERMLTSEIAISENATPSPCGTAHDGDHADASMPPHSSVEAARSQHPCRFVSAIVELRLASREPPRFSYEKAVGLHDSATPSPPSTAHDGACDNARTPSDRSVEAARSQHPCCFVSAIVELRLASREPPRFSYEKAVGLHDSATPSPCGTAHDGDHADASIPPDSSVEAARSQHPCCVVSAVDELRLGSHELTTEQPTSKDGAATGSAPYGECNKPRSRSESPAESPADAAPGQYPQWLESAEAMLWLGCNSPSRGSLAKRAAGEDAAALPLLAAPTHALDHDGFEAYPEWLVSAEIKLRLGQGGPQRASLAERAANAIATAPPLIAIATRGHVLPLGNVRGGADDLNGCYFTAVLAPMHHGHVTSEDIFHLRSAAGVPLADVKATPAHQEAVLDHLRIGDCIVRNGTAYFTSRARDLYAVMEQVSEDHVRPARNAPRSEGSYRLMSFAEARQWLLATTTCIVPCTIETCHRARAALLRVPMGLSRLPSNATPALTRHRALEPRALLAATAALAPVLPRVRTPAWRRQDPRASAQSAAQAAEFAASVRHLSGAAELLQRATCECETSVASFDYSAAREQITHVRALLAAVRSDTTALEAAGCDANLSLLLPEGHPVHHSLINIGHAVTAAEEVSAAYPDDDAEWSRFDA